MSDFADLKVKTDDQVADQLVELKREQMNLRFQRSGGQLEKTNQIRAVRRNIARIKTFISAGQAAAAPKAAKAAPAKKPAAKKSGAKAA